MTVLGTALFAASMGCLGWRFLRAPRWGPFPAYGIAGVGLMLAAALLVAWKVWLAAVFLTPMVWTGYILAVDAAVFAVRGRSLLMSNREAFGWMALLSIPLWLIFEAYNLRLQNWRYEGLPESLLLRLPGYLWSFATIWPGVLETADLLLATQSHPAPRRPLSFPGRLLALAGALQIVIPPLLPAAAGGYLFGLVWMGFAFLLDPLNCEAGRASIVGDLRHGNRRRLGALLAAGVICGFVWEFWNSWATAKWVYIFPILQQAKIFEMPLPGYLGFPTFGVEGFAMYVYVTGRLRVPYYEVG
ncbi:MAG: hypothetical protein HY238_25295 [Acidobacteria bacterium]|nr:hypothetical protein [Acidobacteriota bacterium]